MKKPLILPGFLALVTLSACNASAPIDTPVDTTMSSAMSSEDMMMQSSDTMMSSSDDIGIDLTISSSSAASVAGTTADARVINMTVEDWKFSPNAIQIAKGEKVILRLSDTAGVHGFASSDLGINIKINPGETKDIVIPSDKAGTFAFRCPVPCGPGHKDMTGAITVI